MWCGLGGIGDYRRQEKKREKKNFFQNRCSCWHGWMWHDAGWTRTAFAFASAFCMLFCRNGVRRYICTRRIDDWCKGRVCSCWKLLQENYRISRDVPETATTFYLLPSRVGKPFLLSYYGMRPGNLVIIPSPPALRGLFTLLRCCPLEEVDLFVSDLCSFFTAIFTCYLPR